MKLQLFDGDECVVTITSSHNFEFEVHKGMRAKISGVTNGPRQVGWSSSVDGTERPIYEDEISGPGGGAAFFSGGGGFGGDGT